MLIFVEGAEQHVGENEYRAEIGFGIFVVQHMMVAPDFVNAEFGDPAIAQFVMGGVDRRPKRGIHHAEKQDSDNPGQTETECEKQ